MHSSVNGGLGRLPAVLLQEILLNEGKDLDFERTAALDHLLVALVPKPPHRQVAAWTGAYNQQADIASADS